MLNRLGTVRSAVLGSSLLALVFRVLYLIESADNPFRRSLGLDMEVYDLWAKQIVAGTPPSGPFLQAPLFPYLLAVTYRIFGEDPVRAVWAQLLPSVVAVGLTAAAAGTWRGARAAWCAGILLAIHTPAIFYTGVLLPPTWAATFSAAVLVLAIYLMGNRSASATPSRSASAAATRSASPAAARSVSPAATRSANPSPARSADQAPTRSASAARGAATPSSPQRRTTSSSAALMWSAFGLGVSGGLLTLAQPAAITLVVVPLLLLGRSWRQRRTVALRNTFVAACVGLVLPLGVTLLHNGPRGAWTPVAVNSGINLYIGNGPDANGAYVRPAGMEENRDLLGIEAARRALGAETTAAGANQYWTKRALGWMAGHPGRTLGLFARKLLFFVGDYEIPQVESLAFERRYSLLLRFPLLSFGVLLGLGVLGAVWLKRDSTSRWIAASLLLFAVSVSLFFVTARFRVPAAPWLAVLAGAGVAAVLERRSQPDRTDSRTWVGPAAAAAVAVVVSYGAGSVLGIDRAAAGAQYEYRLGAVAERQGNTEEAIQRYRSALAADSTLAKASLNLGTLLARRGSMAEARPLLERAVRLDATSGIARQNLGQLHEVEGRTEEARRAYEAAVAAEPGLVSARESLAYLLYRSGEIDASREQLLIVMRTSPEGSPPQLRSAALHAVMDARRALAVRAGGQDGVEAAWWHCRPLLEADVQFAQRKLDEARGLYEDAAQDPRFAPYAQDILRQMAAAGSR